MSQYFSSPPKATTTTWPQYFPTLSCSGELGGVTSWLVLLHMCWSPNWNCYFGGGAVVEVLRLANLAFFVVCLSRRCGGKLFMAWNLSTFITILILLHPLNQRQRHTVQLRRLWETEAIVVEISLSLGYWGFHVISGKRVYCVLKIIHERKGRF